jgi:hypothetical protein
MGAQALGQVFAIGAFTSAFRTFQGNKQASHKQSLIKFIAGPARFFHLA